MIPFILSSRLLISSSVSSDLLLIPSSVQVILTRKTVETVSDFIFWGSKITADGDCSHEIKRRLLPWKKSYDQPK